MAVLVPSASAIAPDVVPDVKLVPFTFIVAWVSVVTGVTVIVAVALLTLEVYPMVAELNTGVNATLEPMADREAMADGALVTVMV